MGRPWSACSQILRRGLMPSFGFAWRMQQRESGRRLPRRARRHGQRRLCQHWWGPGRSWRRRRNWRPSVHDHRRFTTFLCSRRKCCLRVRHRSDGRPDLYLDGYLRGVRVLGAHGGRWGAGGRGGAGGGAGGAAGTGGRGGAGGGAEAPRALVARGQGRHGRGWPYDAQPIGTGGSAGGGPGGMGGGWPYDARAASDTYPRRPTLDSSQIPCRSQSAWPRTGLGAQNTIGRVPA